MRNQSSPKPIPVKPVFDLGKILQRGAARCSILSILGCFILIVFGCISTICLYSITPTYESQNEAENSTADPLDEMVTTFKGDYSREEIKDSIDELLSLYYLKKCDKNYELVGNVLTRLKEESNTEVAEMDILTCVLESYSLDLKMDFPEYAALCVTLLDNEE